MKSRPKAKRKRRKHETRPTSSPINFLTADDPPAMLFYNEADRPLPANAPAGAGIHHPNFGKKLKEKMDALKIECGLKHQDDYRSGGGNLPEDTVKFFLEHFGMTKATPKK